MLTVVCALSSGGDFKPEHVRRLLEQVDNNLKEPYRFVCLSNTDVGDIPTVRMESLSGWWMKLNLFWPFRDKTLYFDLDTDIIGDLSWLINHNWPADITGHKSTRDGGFASGMMYWDGDYSEITKTFTLYQDYYLKLPGDQNAIRQIAKGLGYSLDSFQNHFPHEVVSFKRHVRPRNISRRPSVILYHGKPRPWEVPEEKKEFLLKNLD